MREKMAGLTLGALLLLAPAQAQTPQNPQCPPGQTNQSVPVLLREDKSDETPQANATKWVGVDLTRKPGDGSAAVSTPAASKPPEDGADPPGSTSTSDR